jgi:hypothetical protein
VSGFGTGINQENSEADLGTVFYRKPFPDSQFKIKGPQKYEKNDP